MVPNKLALYETSPKLVLAEKGPKKWEHGRVFPISRVGATDLDQQLLMLAALCLCLVITEFCLNKASNIPFRKTRRPTSDKEE